ncbi:MAG: transketolase family protein, partial [Planctomycetota bacterium]
MAKQNCRVVYGETRVELGRENQRIVALEAHLIKTTKTPHLEHEFTERLFEMGIGEQNMISTAVGLALSGKIAFANSFAVFAAGRPYDQIRVSVCI